MWTPGRINLYPPWWTLDCERSLSFFRFSESNARARERRSRKTRDTRAISRLAPSVTRVVICVSRVLLDGLQKKERLLVVYVNTYPICDSLEIGCAVTEIAPPQPFFYVNRSPNRYGFPGGPKVTRYSVDIALNFQRIFLTWPKLTWSRFRRFGTPIGSLSKDVGYVNEKGKKAEGLDWQNNNFARASLFFLHFFAVTARPRREND